MRAKFNLNLLFIEVYTPAQQNVTMFGKMCVLTMPLSVME